MKHWSISRKMATLVAVPLALIVVISVVAFFSLRTLTSTTNELYNEKMTAIRLLDEIRLNNREVEASILELILDKSEEGVKKNTERIETLQRSNEKLIKEYKTLPSNKALKDMVNSYESMLDGYGKQMENIQRKAVGGNSEEAYFLYSMNLKNITQEINVNTLAKMAEINTKMAKDLYKEAEKEATITMVIMIVAAIAAMLLTAVIGFIVMRSITKPIVALKGLMSRVRDGDLRVQSDYEARDEIGQLMNDFNAMTANLQQLIVDMKTKSDSLSMSAAQMSASSEHTSKAAEQITELIAESTTALDEQMSIADQSATMMEEMVVAIQRIAEAYQEVAESSSDAMRQAETGDRNVKRIMEQMDTISANSESTSTLVAELGERTKAISDIVGVITSIADQTNLLALNAAIEAARAGEHGKGFAVVAAEVRKLAEQSRNSAESIVGLITQIVSDTDRAITAMRAGNEQARSGAAIAKEAGEGFGLILEAVRRSAEQVHEVSAISEEMTASVEQMASTVQTMRSSSEHSLSGAQTISGSTEEQMAAIQQISASAQHVYDLSQQLQQSAAQFIVDDVDVKPKRQPVYPTVVTEEVVEKHSEVVEEEITEEVVVNVVEDVVHDEQLIENEVREEERELVKQ